MNYFQPWLRRGFWAMLPLALLACSPAGPAVTQADRAQRQLDNATRQLFQTPDRATPWMSLPMPGKRFVVFEPVDVNGVAALRVKADESLSIIRQRFEIPLRERQRLSFQWKIDALPQDADLALADRSDSPVGVLLAFDGDRASWSARDHRMSELTRLLTGEELPHATLAYVWSDAAPVGAVVINPRSSRIRKLVLDAGAADIGTWRMHVRDVHADYRLAFGEEPGPLRAVALMTDTDNTRSRLTAWYGPMEMRVDSAGR